MVSRRRCRAKQAAAQHLQPALDHQGRASTGDEGIHMTRAYTGDEGMHRRSLTSAPFCRRLGRSR